MRKLFEEEAYQKKFEEAVAMYEQYRATIASNIDISNPPEVLAKLGEICNIQHVGATAKAMFQFLLDKYTIKKLKVVDMNDRSATERKAILSSEIGDVQFYDTIMELLIKESHYQIEILRSALSYLKTEMKTFDN